MSVQSEITRLEEAKAAIAAAIAGKEVAVPDGVKLDAMAALIEAISLGVDTSDATATADSIVSGYTAYADGEKITGTIPTQAATTITPGTSAKTAVSAGYYTTGAVTVAGDTDLKAANIKSGVAIFGVTGTYAGLPTGITALTYGTYTLSSDATNFTFTHNLGVTPNFAIAILKDAASSLSDGATIANFRYKKSINSKWGGNTISYIATATGSPSGIANSISSAPSPWSTTQIYMGATSNYPFAAGKTYIVVCGVISGIS